MAWETRNGKGRYYTRSRRIDGRIKREYVGTGEAADLAVELDAIRREHRRVEAVAWRELRAKIEGLDNELASFFGVVDEQVRATLATEGYHQHKRGEWRRKRDKEKQCSQVDESEVTVDGSKTDGGECR